MRSHANITPLDTLLADLRASSRAPRGKWPAGVLTDEQVGLALLARLPLADRDCLTRSAGWRAQALDAARRNDIGTAQGALVRAAPPRDGGVMSREGWLMLRSLHEAAAAYVDYRSGDFDEAWRRSEEALAAANELHDDCGCTHMMPRRVHLVTNLVHMLARRGDAARAMTLAWSLLDYLEGDDDRWPLPHLSARRSHEHFDSATRAASAEKLASEMAFAMDHAPDGAIALLQEGRSHAAGDARESCGELSRAHSWIRLKCWFADGDTESFLSGAARFLEETAGPVSPLWAHVVRDASRCCEGIGSAVAKQLSGELTRLATDGPAAKLRAAG